MDQVERALRELVAGDVVTQHPDTGMRTTVKAANLHVGGYRVAAGIRHPLGDPARSGPDSQAAPAGTRVQSSDAAKGALIEGLAEEFEPFVLEFIGVIKHIGVA